MDQSRPLNEEELYQKLESYALTSPDSVETRLAAIDENTDIPPKKLDIIKAKVQDKQFLILKKFIEENAINQDFSHVPEEEAMPKTNKALVLDNHERGLINDIQKDELLKLSEKQVTTS